MQNVKLSRIKIIYVLVAVVILLIVSIFVLKPNYLVLKYSETLFPSQSFAQFINQAIYSYNGMQFLKTDPIKNKTIVLADMADLPTIRSMYSAGDSGAYVQFTDASLKKSRVLNIFESMSLGSDTNTDGYIWYIDFKKKDIKLVSPDVFDTDVLMYSLKNKGIVFTRVDKSDLEQTSIPNRELVFSDDNTHTTTSLGGAGRSIPKSLNDCGPVAFVCYIGEDISTTEPILWMANKYSQPMKKQVPLKSIRSISAAIDSTSFLIATSKPNSELYKNDELIPVGSLYVYYPSTDRVTKIGDNISLGTSFLLNHSNSLASVLLDNGSYISEGKNLLGFSKYATIKDIEQQSTFDESNKASISSSGDVLFKNTNEKFIIASKNGYKQPEVNEQQTEKIINDCARQYSDYIQIYSDKKIVKVGNIYDDNYLKKNSDFSVCVSKSNSNLLSWYYFSFVGLSPRDGRFVTN